MEGAGAQAAGGGAAAGDTRGAFDKEILMVVRSMEGRPRGELEAEFTALDADGSGGITAGELARWAGSEPPTDAKRKFSAASAAAVSSLGWQAIFSSYDTDGSGTLDTAEFIVAVRKDCDIGPAVVSDAELAEMFLVADDDAR